MLNQKRIHKQLKNVLDAHASFLDAVEVLQSYDSPTVIEKESKFKIEKNKLKELISTEFEIQEDVITQLRGELTNATEEIGRLRRLVRNKRTLDSE